MKSISFNKLTLVDWLTIAGFIALVLMTAYHLFHNQVFNPSDFGESIMMLIFGKGGHTAVNVADKYFNTPDDVPAAPK